MRTKSNSTPASAQAILMWRPYMLGLRSNAPNVL